MPREGKRVTRELIIERVRRAALFYVDGNGEFTIRAAADRYAVSKGAVHAAVKRIREERGRR